MVFDSLHDGFGTKPRETLKGFSYRTGESKLGLNLGPEIGGSFFLPGK